MNKTTSLWETVISEGTYHLEMPDELVIRSINMFKRESPKKILDVGCGLGRHIQLFAERGHTVLGVDIALSAIRKSRVKAVPYPRAYLALCDVTHLPVSSNQFCLVLAWRMLHLNDKDHIDDALKDIHRILRPNGIIICSVRSTSNTLYFKGKREGREIEPGTFVIDVGGIAGLIYHFFSRQEIETTFSKYFTISSIEEKELEHTSYTSNDKKHRNWFWIIIGRKRGNGD
ncbi:MAG: class I SAM-dependent methyltransferase [Candidatus Desulfatibia sp.]|uniref:class I SAM-dependent methyltransferase n=1 Tax=Candidatus Desulfatibia sp. TaxID=3101189 RepID=UPI002F2C0235